MLYEKKYLPFNDEDFKNPSSEYRAAPFWAWNTKLNKDELICQIEELKKMGFGGFHIHVRTGMATEYLSEEYMELVGACVEKARKEKMLVWLYDEDRWPSGSAGGFVTRNENYRISHLLLTRHPYGSSGKPRAGKHTRATSGRTENGKLIACFDVILDDQGDIKSYRLIREDEAAQGIKLFAYVERARPSPWFNNQTYVNTLDKKAIGEFIKITYERYKKHFVSDFGILIPAIFTDEPQFSQKGSLGFATEDVDITLPWTADIGETYSAAFDGESLINGLPELIWELPEGKVSRLRYRYHDHIAEIFVSAFVAQCGAWCQKNGLMLTGHMMEEPTLESQTAVLGDVMRSYRYFQLPGIDMLCDRHEYTTAKQATSAARQNGVPGILSELYGVTNWDFDFRHQKSQGDWQAALGVMVRVPHLSWVSMNGESKRDYPAVFNYQAPWYKEYAYIENYFARIAYVMTRGDPIVHVGVIHPIESYWIHSGIREKTEAIRQEMDNKFKILCDWLLSALIDFDYISESNLSYYCPVSGIDSTFPVGKMRYNVIVVPAMETIRQNTMDRLELFQKAGGTIIFLGNIPQYIDAKPDGWVKKFAEKCMCRAFDRLSILDALHEFREIEIRDNSGSLCAGLLYQMREEIHGADITRYVFIANADNPKNSDIPRGGIVTIKIHGMWKVKRLDTISGESTELPFRHEHGETVITHILYEHDSVLLCLEKTDIRKCTEDTSPDQLVKELVKESRHTASHRIHFPFPVSITLHEPNVLLLDMAEYSLDGGSYRAREQILRIDNILRRELGWPERSEDFVQPWVEDDNSTPHTIRLRYTFDSEEIIKNSWLALENTANTEVYLNCDRVDKTDGWYVDRCIGKVILPRIKQGTNIFELVFPYGKKTDVEAIYLLGDFGVTVAGTICKLTKPVKTLAFGDITRQGLPFYGGNLTYHLNAESRSGTLVITTTNYRGHLLKVSVDEKDCGVIAYAPYRLVVTGLSDGSHKIDLHYFGSRINTFGQLHSVDKSSGLWWGPHSWRSFGAEWSDEYCFWPQGVLKSPELYDGFLKYQGV
jgi:hypothetical protein